MDIADSGGRETNNSRPEREGKQKMLNFKYFLIGFFLSGVIVNLLRSNAYACVAMLYVVLAASVAVFWPKRESSKKMSIVINNFGKPDGAEKVKEETKANKK